MSRENKNTRLVDDADLLESYEEEILLEQLDEISEDWQFDVVVVTADDLNGRSAEEYAENFYDFYGYGMGPDRDGALLLVSMEEREWYITTTGSGMWILGDDELDTVSEAFLPDLSDGNYLEAFETYAEWCDLFLAQAENGESLPAGSYVVAEIIEKEKTVEPIWILGSLLIGFLVALIPVSVMKGKLKSVRKATAANQYVREGSFQVTEMRDLFLYRNVTRVARPKDNAPKGGGRPGGGHGGGGRSGGGHGGKGGRF